MNGLDITAEAGETINLKGVAIDPDGDELSYRWWRYADVDTLDGTGTIELSTTPDAAFTVPADAKVGDTIHLIFETTDAPSNTLYTSLKIYKRVILTVAESDAVDKTELDALIAEAKDKNEEDYTAESWRPFTEALEKAESVSADDNATQDDVDGAVEALRIAMGELEPFIEVTSVKIDGAAIQQVRMRNTKKFTATVNPSNATAPTLKWESSNPKIFTVDNGLVTGLGTGNAKLIVTCGGKTSFIMVQVTA